MARLISPSESHIFASGINSTSFLKGYDPATKVWDKSLCGMQQGDRISAIKVEPRVYREACLLGKELFYGQGDLKAEWGSFDRLNYFKEKAFWGTSFYAHINAKAHGGDRLILVMKHPSCRLQGIDYQFQEMGDPDQLFIYPGKVLLDRVYRIASLTFFEGTEASQSLRLEDITDSFE